MLSIQLKNSFRIAVKNKVFTAVNIIGLGIGLACFMLIMLWVRNEMTYENFNPNANRIYILNKLNNIGTGTTTTQSLPYLLGPEIKQKIAGVETFVRTYPKHAVVSKDEIIFRETKILAADTNFFKVFPYKFINGNSDNALSSPYSVVLTSEIAKKYFGANNPIGQSIRIRVGISDLYTITGVIEDLPSNTIMDFDFVLPIDPLFRNKKDQISWYSHMFDTYIQTSTPIECESFNSKLTDILNQHYSEGTPKDSIIVQPLIDEHLYSPEGNRTGMQYILIFSIIAVFILVIACINYINLATAIASKRMREVGLKKVIGATKFELILQFLLEAFIQTIIAMIFAIVAIELLLPTFIELTGKEISWNYFDIINLMFMLGLIVIITIISGAYPAFYTSSFQPTSVFRGASESGRSKITLRKILVIVQFTVAVVLIISTGIIYYQLKFIQNKELGYDKENLLYMPFDKNIGKKYEAFKKELLSNPSITNISRCSEIPSRIKNKMNGLTWEGKTENTSGHFYFESIDADFIRTMNLKVVAGRNFSDDFLTDSINYIFNEKAVKLMGFKDPIGQQFELDGPPGKIVGVVRDYNIEPLTNDIAPLMFIMWRDWYWTLIVRVNPENLNKTIKYIENTWKQFAPDSPFEYDFISNNLQRQYKAEQRMSKLVTIFSILIVIITTIGLFSLATYTAQQKTKETGIRKVLGARVLDIISLFTLSFVKWVVIANIIAWPIAWYLCDKWLQDFAYRVEISLLIFPLIALATILLAIVTISFQTWKTANLNPVESLRHTS
ncbi:MAG: ABC transporter permease [Bacteroidales bacterium]|nr:MAG: ABC transporter permease [Bacteroidales bacterium]